MKTPQFPRSMLCWAALAATGCEERNPIQFTEAQTLGGESVDAATLNRGQNAYRFYCAQCHGLEGNGRGLSSPGLRPPPRDFRIATYKFGGVPEGSLPHDDALVALVRDGLHGTAMLRWNLEDHVLLDVVQYIKTFSPEGDGWRDPDNEKGEPIGLGEDPWGEDRAAEAVARGNTIYHGIATCYSCHPSYATPAEINTARAASGQSPLQTFRDKLWLPEPKTSDSYSVPLEGDPPCGDETTCQGEDQVCRLGVCEQKLKIIPPDYTINEIRSGTDLDRLARVIGTGIPGTAMPSWSDSLDPKDIWAMAYFVKDLSTKKGTPEAGKIKSRVKATVR